MALWIPPLGITGAKGDKSYGGIYGASRTLVAFTNILDISAYSEYNVIEDSGVNIGDPHPNTTAARVIRISAGTAETVTATEGPFVGQRCIKWEISLDYGQLSPSEAEFASNPLAMPPIWTFDGDFDEEIAIVDRLGAPILNSAYDPFDPNLFKLIYKGVLVGRINLPLAYVSIPALEAFSGKTNSDQVGDFPPRTLRVGALSLPEPTPFPAGNFRFYQLMPFSFAYKRDTWVRKVKDQGYRQLGDDGFPVKIMDNKGQYIDVPAFLDGEGRKLEPPFSPSDTVDLEFEVDDEISFLDAFPFLGTDWKNV